MGTTLADAAQVGCWVALSVLGVLCGALQRRGRDYYPANLLIGLALGSQGFFYVFFAVLFRADIGALRAWAAATHAALYIYGLEIAVALWANGLVWRVNRGRAGSAADLTGHLGPPTPEMVEEALVVIDRGDRHGVMNAVQRKWLREDRDLARAARRAGKRHGIE